jgi:uncharacterized protein YbaR (Trm112 family)
MFNALNHMEQKKIKQELLEIIECPISKSSLRKISVIELNRLLPESESKNYLTIDKSINKLLINENDTIVYIVKNGIPILDPSKSIILKT